MLIYESNVSLKFSTEIITCEVVTVIHDRKLKMLQTCYMHVNARYHVLKCMQNEEISIKSCIQETVLTKLTDFELFDVTPY